jgi:hypothetical protein
VSDKVDGLVGFMGEMGAATKDARGIGFELSPACMHLDIASDEVGARQSDSATA